MSSVGSGKHVIIIGAGPAGLAAAVCLTQCKVPYTLLEQGSVALSALRHVDPEMVLLSPTALSLLPEMESPSEAPPYLSFRLLVSALERYQEKHDLRIVNDVQVVQVDHDGEAFLVRCRGTDHAERVFAGSHVINATGIISHPQLPSDLEPCQCSFQWLHSIDARAHGLAQARRLLVVGGGPSAAEVLERWLNVCGADARAWLSLRSPLRAVPHWIWGVDVHYLSWLAERFPTSYLGWKARPFREPMIGLTVRRAIKTRLITRTPAVQSYRGDTVTLSDGHRLQPDLVVFSTGFRYASEPLARLLDYDAEGRLVRKCESTRTRGLYLLGFRFGRTFASPYLRGIARDAQYVAERIVSDRRGIDHNRLVPVWGFTERASR